VILTVIWTVYGFFYWRSRGETRPGRSIDSFNQNLALLGRAMQAPVADTSVVHRPRVTGAEIARQRRREVLQALAVGAAATFLLALAFGGPLVLLHLLADVLLGGYVALLVRRNQLLAEQSQKVIALPSHEAAQDERDDILLVRSGT
jgi:hypothetical protein